MNTFICNVSVLFYWKPLSRWEGLSIAHVRRLVSPLSLEAIPMQAGLAKVHRGSNRDIVEISCDGIRRT